MAQEQHRISGGRGLEVLWKKERLVGGRRLELPTSAVRTPKVAAAKQFTAKHITDESREDVPTAQTPEHTHVSAWSCMTDGSNLGTLEFVVAATLSILVVMGGWRQLNRAPDRGASADWLSECLVLLGGSCLACCCVGVPPSSRSMKSGGSSSRRRSVA